MLGFAAYKCSNRMCFAKKLDPQTPALRCPKHSSLFRGRIFAFQKTVAGFHAAQLFISKFGPADCCQRVSSIPARISGLKL